MSKHSVSSAGVVCDRLRDHRVCLPSGPSGQSRRPAVHHVIDLGRCHDRHKKRQQKNPEPGDEEAHAPNDAPKPHHNPGPQIEGPEPPWPSPQRLWSPFPSLLVRSDSVANTVRHWSPMVHRCILRIRCNSRNTNGVKRVDEPVRNWRITCGRDQGRVSQSDHQALCEP